MGRTPTDPDKKLLSFTMRLLPDQLAFLDELREESDQPSQSDAVRNAIRNLQTMFGLPPYQAERLRKDMKTRGLNIVQYLQELLARRYEQLAEEDRSAKKPVR